MFNLIYLIKLTISHMAGELEQEICTATKIIGKRRTRLGFEYLTQWKEYPGDDTWEPAQNLSNVKDLIDEYEESEKVKALGAMNERPLIRKRDDKASYKA
jgi:hypothetical protein